MAKDDHSGRNARARKASAPQRSGRPDWAQGLRQLYDSVVEEPLPDNFRELLSRLDE